MEKHDGYIKYNDDKTCYGMMGRNGNWIKEELEDGDRVDVVINGEKFATNYIKEYHCRPVLKPHVWNNWEFLTTIPAIYYDSKKTVKEKPLAQKEMQRLRYIGGSILIAISIVVPAIFGALFAFIGLDANTTYLRNFVVVSKTVFWLVGAGFVSSAILLIANILPNQFCIGFGCALYYGTILLSAFLSNFIYGADINRYFISFTIVALVCYIVWIRKFKPNNE